MEKPINNEIINAYETIKPLIRKTPFLKSTYFSKLLNGEIFFKLENLQVTGSFKLRGALNKLLSLSSKQRKLGVISASTGNHGSALAYGANRLGIQCSIIVPKEISKSKLKIMKGYVADIEHYGIDCIQCEKKAKMISLHSGRTYVSPYNDYQVIVGQGTAGLEIGSQTRPLDIIFISVGGGGLISGVGIYLKSLWPNLKIVGCSPENSAVMIESIKAGKILQLESKNTISDGTAGGIEKDTITFSLCKNLIDETILLSEKEIKDAMKIYIKNENQIIEGAAGTVVAGMIKMKSRLKNKKVGVIICGGNINLGTLKEII